MYMQINDSSYCIFSSNNLSVLIKRNSPKLTVLTFDIPEQNNIFVILRPQNKTKNENVFFWQLTVSFGVIPLQTVILGTDCAVHSFLAQSGQQMLSPLMTKRLLPSEREHFLQLKQYSCHEYPSQFTTLVPWPNPAEKTEGHLSVGSARQVMILLEQQKQYPNCSPQPSCHLPFLQHRLT